MNFQRTTVPGFGGTAFYVAYASPWRFLIIDDRGKWTASYRLIKPTGPVSASSTIMGPFDSFGDAEAAAQAKLLELKRLA